MTTIPLMCVMILSCELTNPLHRILASRAANNIFITNIILFMNLGSFISAVRAYKDWQNSANIIATQSEKALASSHRLIYAMAH